METFDSYVALIFSPYDQPDHLADRLGGGHRDDTIATGAEGLRGEVGNRGCHLGL
ncbi:MAG: hypothetical protein SOW36_01035 [Porphyromonas sp.]|nr:hypothetical protein [Porphyromonas sp.]